MDDKLKLVGVGIVVGVIIAVVLFKVLGAEPNAISIGPIEFELPTATPITRSSEGSNSILESGSVTQPPNVILYQTDFLGEWIYQEPRAPMPAQPTLGQVVFAYGDIDNSGTCHITEFNSGELVQGLGLGSFKLWLITGDAEYIREVKNQLQNGAATHAGTECPPLP